MVEREAHKIWINPIVWDRLKKEAELKGIGISEYLEAIIMREVWQPNEPKPIQNNTPPKYTIKELVHKGLEKLQIPHDYAKHYLVLYCKECNRIYLLSRNSIEPWICDHEHKLEPLGTANLFL